MMTDRTAYELAIAEAYRAGAEEMRERAAQWAFAYVNATRENMSVHELRDGIRALPVE